MTTLAKAVNEYLALRRGLGFKMQQPAHALPNFVAFLRSRGAHRITTRLALAWAVLPTGTKPQYLAGRLMIVRGFARYCNGLDPRHQIPPSRLLSCRHTRRQPYIYTDDDVRRLTRAASALPSPTGLRGLTYGTLISLLAVTGMRIGEAIGLDLADVDLPGALLTVRGAKFGKSRHIPLHPSSVEAIRSYLETRSRARHRSFPSLLVSEGGTRLSIKTVECTFIRLLRSSGLRSPRNRKRSGGLHRSGGRIETISSRTGPARAKVSAMIYGPSDRPTRPAHRGTRAQSRRVDRAGVDAEGATGPQLWQLRATAVE